MDMKGSLLTLITMDTIYRLVGRIDNLPGLCLILALPIGINDVDNDTRNQCHSSDNTTYNDSPIPSRLPPPLGFTTDLFLAAGATRLIVGSFTGLSRFWR